MTRRLRIGGALSHIPSQLNAEERRIKRERALLARCVRIVYRSPKILPKPADCDSCLKKVDATTGKVSRRACASGMRLKLARYV